MSIGIPNKEFKSSLINIELKRIIINSMNNNSKNIANNKQSIHRTKTPVKDSNTSTSTTSTERRVLQQGTSGKKPLPSRYFSAESLLVLFCLTASLLILPLILPPLPPPPSMLLLLPLGILLVLLVLALMPSDIASSYL